jgi:DNA helicase-4
MFNRKRFKPDGHLVRPRGVKLARRRKFEPELPTVSGVRVRSSYEQRTADYLTKNGINFQYEPLILLDGKQYRPDFFLPRYNLFLEICGMGHMPFYRDHVEQKRRLYQKHNLCAIFIPYNGKGSLEKIIKEELQPYLSAEK